MYFHSIISQSILFKNDLGKSTNLKKKCIFVVLFLRVFLKLIIFNSVLLIH